MIRRDKRGANRFLTILNNDLHFQNLWELFFSRIPLFSSKNFEDCANYLKYKDFLLCICMSSFWLFD